MAARGEMTSERAAQLGVVRRSLRSWLFKEKRQMRFWQSALCVVLLSACSAQEPPSSSKLVKLPSGKVVRVYSITRITFGDNSHPPSLMIRYETAFPPKDSEGLRAEVKDVWELLKPLADQAHDSYAMVKANEPIRGPLTTTAAFTYGFARSDDGQWQLQEPRKREPKTPVSP